MKIQMITEDRTVTWEATNDDPSINEVIDGVTCCLRGLTWLETTIFKGYKEAAEEYAEIH